MFSIGKWQNWFVPVENGAPKRGGRLSESTGFSMLIIARLLDVVVLRVPEWSFSAVFPSIAKTKAVSRDGWNLSPDEEAKHGLDR